MKSPWRSFLSISIVVVGAWLSSTSFGQPYDNFPENVRQSFAWGITDNKALSRDDLESMAAAVLLKTDAAQLEQAISRVKLLPDVSLRRMIIKPFLIDYVEISVKDLRARGDLGVHVSKYMDDEILYSPVRFIKNGEDYVRWFIHPLRFDLSFLKFLGNPQIKSGQFVAQMTESRSVLIMDRNNGHYWTIKLSLPKAMGPFRDKAYSAQKAESQFKLSEYLLSQKKLGVYEDTQYLHEQEALTFKTEGFNEGQVVRSLAIFKQGVFLLPYSSIYTNGLAQYLSPQEAQLLKLLETKWLSHEPGLAAARLYKRDKLALNSNHAQNSMLVLSPQKNPVGYIRRDMDFDLDSDKFENSPAKAFLSVEHVHAMAIDFSMTNGFGDLSYYSARAAQIAESFFMSMLNEYQRLRDKPVETESIQSNIIFKDHHYSLPVWCLQSRQEIRETEALGYSKILIDLMLKYPVLNRFELYPVSTLKFILSIEGQKLGDSVPYGSIFLYYWPIKLQNAWGQLIAEYMNPRTHAKSLIYQSLHHREEAFFWNLAILAGQLYNPNQEKFMDQLIQEAAQFRNGASIHFVFEQIKKKGLTQRPYLKERSDLPADYWRLLSSYREKFKQLADKTLESDFKILDGVGSPISSVLSCIEDLQKEP